MRWRQRSPGKAASPAPYPADVTRLDDVAALVAAIGSELGPVSVVTNAAAAFGAIGPIWEVDPAAWWRDVEITIRGSFNVCRAVLPGMIGRKRGRIINMAGGGTAGSFPYGSGYATGKAGICPLHRERFGLARREPAGSCSRWNPVS